MRKPLLFVLIAVAVVLLGSTALLYVRLQQRSADFTSLQAEQKATTDRYGQAINEIAAIQDSLNAIALGDEGVQKLATELDTEKGLSRASGDEAMARISVIKAGIERTKDKIQDLDQKLHQSGVKVAGLEKLITNLRQQVSQKEEQIAALTQRVGVLETQVTGLTAQVQEGQRTIAAQADSIESSRRELGTVYYAIASKKQLAAAKMVVSKGGFLGIGKTLKLTGQFDDSLFSSLDTDQQSVIYIPAAKAQVLSEQPTTSYDMELVGGQMELHILDPKAFRAIKRVVIMTG